MGMICLPEAWDRQPDYLTGIERSVVPRCSFCFLPYANQIIDLDDGQFLTVDTAGTNGTPGAFGEENTALFANATGYSQYRIKTNCSFGTGDFWILLRGTFVSVASTVVALSNDYAQSAGTKQWRMQPNYNGSATSAGAMSFLTYGGAGVYTGANSLLVPGTLQTFLGVRRGTTVELWRDGVLASSNTGTVQDVSGAETQKLGFGWGTSSGYTAGGHRSLAAGGFDSLSQEQAASLSANPWQIFQP